MFFKPFCASFDDRIADRFGFQMLVERAADRDIAGLDLMEDRAVVVVAFGRSPRSWRRSAGPGVDRGERRCRRATCASRRSDRLLPPVAADGGDAVDGDARLVGGLCDGASSARTRAGDGCGIVLGALAATARPSDATAIKHQNLRESKRVILDAPRCRPMQQRPVGGRLTRPNFGGYDDGGACRRQVQFASKAAGFAVIFPAKPAGL